MFQNLKKLFPNTMRIFAYIVLVAMTCFIWWYFTDVAIMVGNYGKLHTYTDVTLSMIMVFGFPLFLIAFWHKSTLFGKDSVNTKTGAGIIGGIIGTLISGASCCGATLAAYVGLLPLMTLLPYDGLELKILGTIGLLYAFYDIMKNLEVCQMRK